MNLSKSLADMSREDRYRLRRQINTHLDAKIDKVLPKRTQIKLTDPLKQCYMFMRSFQAGDLKQAPPKRTFPVFPQYMMTTTPVKNESNNAMQDFLSGQKLQIS